MLTGGKSKSIARQAETGTHTRALVSAKLSKKRPRLGKVRACSK